MKLIAIILGFVILDDVYGESGCSSNAQFEISKCLSEMGLDPEMGGGSALVTDTDRARKVCRDGSLDKAISCMENVFTVCIEHKQKDNLEKLVNIERWRTGMNLLCENLDGLIQNDKCIQESNVQSQVCVERESNQFKIQLQAKVTSGGSSPDEIMTFSCIYADKLVECMRKPLANYCPTDIKNVMTGVVKSFMPPICDPYWESASSGSRMPEVSILITAISAIIGSAYAHLC